MKYLKARSQTTAETADSPIVIQKKRLLKPFEEVKVSAKGSAERPCMKITELIVGEISSSNSLQDFVHGISVRVSWDR